MGRPCEGYTCEGATTKPAESAQAMDVHASESGERLPEAQQCRTANSETNNASTLSMSLNSDSIPNSQVAAPVEKSPNLRRLEFPISDRFVNQQTASATVTSAAYRVTSNKTVVRWSERSREPTRKRKLGDDHTTPVSTRGYGQAGSAQERTYRLFETHNPDLDEKQVSLTGRLTETKNEHF